ncbi:MAG: hypothetical protein KKD11_08100, partial [Candidatus Omnitrophica bacterium]|nr:hypothetical protein [Candidatus Omnitrophota bacterium]
AILTRAEFVFYPIVLFFYLLGICKWSAKNFLKRFFVFYLLIVLTLTPWVIRNYGVYKKIIPLATYHGGIAFWTGNCSLASGGWAYPLDYKETMKKVKNMGEYEQNKEFFKKGMEELKRKPGRIPILFIRKILVHWAPFENGFKLFNAYYAVVLLLATVGISFFRKRNIREHVLLIIFLATTLTSIIIYGDPRYRYAYEPYLIIFAGVTINEILKRLSNARSFCSGKRNI